MPAYRAMPATGTNFADGARGAGSLRRPRAHQGRLPAPGEGGVLRDRARALCAAGRPVEVHGHPQAHLGGGDQGPRRAGDGDLDATVAYAKSTGKAEVARLGITGFCWGGRIVYMYAAHNPNVRAGVAWYGMTAKAFAPGRQAPHWTWRGRSRRPCSASTAAPTRASRTTPWKRCSRRCAAAGTRSRSSRSTPTRRTPSMRTTGRAIARRRPRMRGQDAGLVQAQPLT